MMKTTKISIILLLVLCFLLIIGLGAILTIGIFNRDFLKKHFVINPDKVTLYDDYQPANKIVVDTDSYDVNFYYHDDDRVLVKVRGVKDDNADVYTKDDILNINVKSKNRIGIFIFNFVNNKIDIYLPRNYDLPIVITGHTSDVRFKEESKSSFDIKLSTGDIYLRNAKESILKVSTGDITITDTFDNGTITTSTGDIKINNAIGKIDFTTTTGDISIKRINLSENSNIKVTTGDIRIDKVNDIYISTNTTTGDVKVKHSNRYSDVELMIKTTTGDITTGKLSE